MLQYGEDAEVSDTASIGSINGPPHTEERQMAAFGSSSPLLMERTVLPRPRYSPYETKVSQVEIGASCVVRGQRQVSTPSLSQHLEEIQTQLDVATGPLSQHVKATSQTLQQTATTAGQALERVSVAQKLTSQLCTDVKGALHEQVCVDQAQTKEETQ